MEITCYRDPEIKREKRTLPATTYNLAVQLFSRCDAKSLFVPIRNMQYLAIIDREEFVFVDGGRKCWVDIAWQNFRSQKRESLDDPIEYEAVYYKENQAAVMRRLQREFPLALYAMMEKQAPHQPAKVIKFKSKSATDTTQ
ncbi:hypothetical protein Nstercoris_01372 [Nitrosomonas stercoris]|uniref:Uncharacterized protein n=1 Tax=Nitrosomonas stercoris TaxID=1444684 RepID=A0A4Y1YLY6_9PROT|nr:hypothetical protein Nstercoris_01372 [Nitrosomonas stercoris]